MNTNRSCFGTRKKPIPGINSICYYRRYNRIIVFINPELMIMRTR